MSMLIVVKLPFAATDSIGYYEQSPFRSKGKGACAILDCRTNSNGGYHRRVLSALLSCRVTSRTRDVERFIHEKQQPAYFTQHELLLSA